MVNAGDQSEEELFHACLELEPEERMELLTRVCADRPELRARIERLLGAHARAEEQTLDPLRGLLAGGGAQSDGEERGGTGTRTGGSGAVDGGPAGTATPVAQPDGEPGPRNPSMATDPVTEPASQKRRLADLHDGECGGTPARAPAPVAWMRFVALLAVLAVLAAAVVGVQSRRAATARERAEAVRDELRAILLERGPLGSPSRPATVVQTLRAAVAELTEGGDRDPAVRVELLCTLGEALLEHQDTAAAEEALRRAVEVARNELAPRDPLALRARVLLAWVHRDEGRMRVLRAELEELLPLVNVRSRRFAEELVTALLCQADLEIEEGRGEAAVQTAKRAAEIAVEHSGGVGRRGIDAALMLARASQAAGDVEGALERAEEAYGATRELRRRRRLEARVLEGRYLYGRALCRVGQAAEGIDLIEDAVHEAETVFGPESRPVGLFSLELSRQHLARGEIRRALETSERAAAILEGLSATDSTRLAEALFVRGEVLLAARQSGEAVSALSRAAEDLTASFGPEHERAVGARALEALALAYDGLPAEGVHRLQDLVEGGGGGSSAEGAASSRLVRALAVARRLSGEPAEALRLLQERRVPAQAEAMDPAAELELARGLAEIGLAQVELGRDDEAVTALLRAQGLYDELSLELTPERADVLVGLGRARIAQQRPQEALGLLEQADAFWRDFDAGSRWGKESAFWLGRCYGALGRRDDARRVLARAPL